MGGVTEGVRELADMIAVRGARLHARAWVADGAGRSVGAADSPARAGAPAPIVLLHGFAQSAASWEGVAPVLARDLGRTVIALDLIGHGASDKPDDDAPYAYDEQARQVADAIRAVADRIGAAPIVIGYSMGGRMALGAVLGHGAPCAALVLESAGLGPVDDDARAAARRVARGNARRMAELALPRFFDWWEDLPLFASQKDLPAEIRARVRAGRLANDPAALERVLCLAGQDRMPDYRPALARAPFPILYLAGSRDPKYAALADTFGDRSVLYQGQRGDTKRTCPHLYQVVEGAGHDVHLEDPAAFVDAVERFVQGIG